jgi:hypothetical protein
MTGGFAVARAAYAISAVAAKYRPENPKKLQDPASRKSALPAKADICGALAHVPLSANSGHETAYAITSRDFRRHQFVDEEQAFSSWDREFGCRVLTIGWSSSLDKMRAAAPSRSSYWPLLSDHKKATRPTAPKANARGIR